MKQQKKQTVAVAPRSSQTPVRKKVASTTKMAHQKKDSEASLQYYPTLLEHIQDAVITTDKHFTILSWNKAAETIYGWNAKEAIGKKARTLLQTKFLGARSKSIEELLSNGYWKGEVIQERKNGKPVTIFSSTIILKDAQDNVLGSLSINRDVTEQKLAEEARLRLAAIVTSSDDAIVSKNLDRIVMSWNAAAEKMFGYKAEEIIGKPITLIIPKELRKEEDEIIAKLKKGQRIDHFQTVRRTKDGRRLHVSISISPIKDASGKVIGVSKIARDITQQKAFEENLVFLAEASKLLSSSLDYNETLRRVAEIAVPHIADWCGVDMIDETGELQQVAVAHKDPKKVAWAKAYRKAHPPEMSDKTGVPGVLRTGKSQLFPVITDEMLVASAKNKKELTLARSLRIRSVMIVPITIKGKTVGALSFVTADSNKEYGAVDLAMAEDLATRASFAIENARLYAQAQRELEQRKKLEKQKDEFIGVASHELKTPVTSIKSFAQVLHLRFQKEGNEKAAEMLGKLDAQVDKLTSLIGDLLDVTKIEAGRMQFNQEYFSFDELVDELVEELQRTTEKHMIIKKGQTNKKILADRERIGQVLTNLISNAIKYSPHTKEIIVHSSVENAKIKLCVQDFGIGIEKEKQEKVFERFFRASGPGQETYPGLGLGLYVSSEIIKRLSGRIWVESRKGRGSTFCFTLPLKRKKIEDELQTVHAEW